MVKLSGSISRKVPIEGIQYSSQSFAAGMEVEVSDGEDPNVIRERIRELYTLLSESIDEQIAGSQNAAPASNGQQQAAPPPARRYVQPQNPQAAPAAAPARAGNGNGRPANRVAAPVGNGGNGRKTAAGETACSDAQRKCIFAITKSLGLTVKNVLADYNYSDLNQLSVKAASQIIDDLKTRQNGNGAPAQ
jgi:hypothetical protein